MKFLAIAHVRMFGDDPSILDGYTMAMIKIASWIGLISLLCATYSILRAASIVSKSVRIISIEDSFFVRLFLWSMCLLLSFRAAQTFASFGFATLLVVLAAYYCIGLISVSSQCVLVCAAVEYLCSSSPIEHAENMIANRVGSGASSVSEQTVLEEIDDHFVQETTFRVEENLEEDSMANRLGDFFNLTSPYFEQIEEICEPMSATSEYCRWALCLSIIAVGGHITGLIEICQRTHCENRPKKVGHGEKQIVISPFEAI